MSGKNGNKDTREGIAIIGLGCVYPKAHSIDQYWKNIVNKVSGIKEIPRDRWDYHLYYNPDKSMPDKTYSKIGGFIDDVDMTEIIKKYKLPPKIVKFMDRAQKYALVSADKALIDAGYGDREFDRNRTAVIIGNSMGGDMIDYTNYRVFMSDVDDHLKKGAAFKKLDPASQKLIMEELQKNVKARLPEVTEDSMPGELANVIAGRIANAMNLTGPNFSVDAACASSMASIRESVKGLRNNDFDMVIAGGSDYMMGPGPFVKFCKIGALSPDGSYPFDARANGFVMGEGTGIFILKRVSDARRDGNKIYAIIRGVGASSDGRGKGITAPNPKGQMLAIERAFEDAGYGSDTVQYVEAHGTATIVGDGAELESLLGVWDKGVKSNSVGLGSIKSNIGHLKAAAGSAAIIKTSLALHHKTLPPSVNWEKPNPNVNFGSIPFRVITKSEPWPEGINGNPRRANASAFGFGGTNFHIALEEDTGTNGMPEERKYYSGASVAASSGSAQLMKESASPVFDYSHPRYRLSAENLEKQAGEAVVIGASSWDEIRSILDSLKSEISANPKITLKDIGIRFNIQSNSKDVRLGISAYSIEEFVDKFDAAKEGIDNLKRRMVLKNRGLFFGDNLLAKKKTLSKVGVLFPGQGNQYVNMLKDLYNKFDVVRETFEEADRVMYDIIGKGMTDITFVPDDASRDEFDRAENQLKQTEYTQPGVLTADYAMFRLLKSYGIKPDVAVGHSLGEYGALIAAGVMSFRDALYAVSARGREIASVKFEDFGKMLSVPAPVKKAEELIKGIDGYVIIANKNCNSQTVVAGDTPSVLKVKERCEAEGIPAQLIPVSHAFHSQIVAPACKSYRKVIESFEISSPKIDIIANLTGGYYPRGENVRNQIVDILVNHIANPVEFIKQIEKMYADGVNVFVEAGPKRTLTSFVVNILEGKNYLAMATNHPKKGGIGTLNDALVAMSTEGFDINWNGIDETGRQMDNPDWRLRDDFPGKRTGFRISTSPAVAAEPAPKREISHAMRRGDISMDIMQKEFQEKQRKLLGDILEIYSQKSAELMDESLSEALFYKREMEKFNINLEKVVISGIAIGLPGKRFSVFGDDVFDRILTGENMIDPLSEEEMDRQLNKNINRLMKSPDGEATFYKIGNRSEVVKLAARKGKFDFEDEYGIDPEFSDRLDIATKLAIAAGIEALRDAGIPLIMNYKTTSTGKQLPTTWGLSPEIQDDTGIIFCSAFPGYNSLIEEVSKEVSYKYGKKSKQELVRLYTSIIERVKDEKVREALSGWFAENYSVLKEVSDENVYQFNRKFLFRILSMGHSQFAEFIKARGPNIQINVACSSTTAAVGMAEDWIRLGRCKRVIVVGGDDVTAPPFLEWIMSGFLAVGAVSTKQDIKEAAIPFDRRRNGMLVGMGAVGIIVEAESEVKKRGMEPIGEVVAVEFLNSAFHGTRLDVNHISSVMERLIKNVEKRLGIKRDEFAKQTVFMSHETYTPARGGSAAAEAASLRKTFGPDYKSVVVANTKGFTGHSMAVGVEDAVVLKALQRGIVPPIANLKETDPELGDLNLSKGGEYKDMRYALRLGAGFGSQIAMSFIKLVSKDEKRIVDQAAYGKWLKQLSYMESPEIEIVKRTLRIKKDGKLSKVVEEAPARQAVAAEAVAVSRPLIQEPVFVKPVVMPEVPASQKAAAGPLNDIKKKIMAIVGEKTGYAEDLIEFDLDMESDLGIDTVKQAEMFGMIRETFNISKDENIKIKDFPTLNHVINFVKEKSPQFKGVDFSIKAGAAVTAPHAAAASATRPQFNVGAAVTAPLSTATVVPQPVAQAAVTAGGGLDEIRKRIVKIVEEKTGYAEDLIEFDLDMESDLGIDTVKQAEMFGMIRETFEISKDESIKIKDFPTLNHVVQFVKAKSPQKFADPVGAAVSAPLSTATVVPQPVAQAAGTAGDGLTEIRKRIIKIVEEKTGYSEDLIEFDLDMESDLGIDTVKQAEMFGMIRETFEISKEESIKIKDFPTLNHVINFVKEKSPQFKGVEKAAATATVSAPHAAVTAAGITPSSQFTSKKESGIKRMTLETVEEALDKNAAPAFKMKGFNILLTDDGIRGVAKAMEKILSEEGANVFVIKQSDMESAEALSKEIERVRKNGKMNAIIHLTPLEEAKDLNDMNFDEWRLSVFRRIKSMYLISKTLQEDIAENGRKGGAFVVSATDMGGSFGIDDFTANTPIGGGVAGLTKSLNKEFNREKKEVRVKAIDFSMKDKPASIAKTIFSEIQLGGDRVEVGYVDKKRMVTQVIYKDLDFDEKPADSLGEGSVFVITGGGYGITSAIAMDLAKHLKPKLAIISLESLPSNVAELAKLDDNGLKQLKEKVVAELKAKNERVTPVMIDKEFRKYTIAIEIHNNLNEMRALGAKDVEYYDCNVMDNKAMTAVMRKIRDKFGPIDAIIHGAGIEQSKLMTDKSFEDFCRVVDVKADGCYNLMEFAKTDKVRALVTFASISGRFGNIGQTDYSAANDLLNKYVQHSNRRFAPNMKGVSLNWSGWMGVGMATRGSITQIFEEAKIDMIPMEEGVKKVREELLYGSDAEVLVAGNVGYIDCDHIIAGEKTAEFAKLADMVRAHRDRYPMIDSIEVFKPGKMITARKRLDTESDIYLRDHAIDNVPYLPAVMGIETFAEISTLLVPGKKIKLMKDIKFKIPVKILKGKPVDLIVAAEKVSTDGNEITVRTRLETEFFNKDGVKLGDNKLHFEATVVLSDKGADKKTLKAGKVKMDLLEKYQKDGKKVINEKEIYRRFFHGPKYQVHGGVIDIGDSIIYGVISKKNGKEGSHFSFVKKANYLTDPMAIEAAFQNAGLYAMKKKNLMSLPDGISELAFTSIPSDAEILFVRAKHVGGDAARHEYDTEVMDSQGNTYSVMKGYKMVTTGELKEDEKF